MADFQSIENDFHDEGVKVLAGSVDSLEKTKAFVEKLGLSYSVAFGMNAEAVSETTGAFYEGEKMFLQPAGFIVRPNNTVETAVYSTGAVGRFVARDVLAVIKYYKSQRK